MFDFHYILGFVQKVKRNQIQAVTLQLRGVYEDKELRNLMRFGG